MTVWTISVEGYDSGWIASVAITEAEARKLFEKECAELREDWVGVYASELEWPTSKVVRDNLSLEQYLREELKTNEYGDLCYKCVIYWVVLRKWENVK